MENLFDAIGFIAYIKKHGNHLTPEVAERASEMICKCSNTKAWSVNEVAEAIIPLIAGKPNGNGYTLGDFVYMTNKYISAFYPEVIGAREKCLQMAIALADSDESYAGMPLLDLATYITNKGIKGFYW